MALSDTSKILISIKKLLGKAHTSNDKGVSNESLPTNISLASNTIFGQAVPITTGSATKYEILSNIHGEGVVEFLRLSASFIAGSDTSDGQHGFELVLPDAYEANSSNPLKGTYPFKNSQSINITSGALQLIPPSFGTPYEADVYHTSSGETQIAVLDSRDWNLDYFNGIYFQQDPPGTGEQATNPKYVDAYLYIGKYSDKGIFSSGLSGSLTQLTDGSSYLAAGSNITILSASNGQITVAGTKELVFNEKLGGTANGSNTHFTLANTPYASSNVSIFLNGQLMCPAAIDPTVADYSITGTNIYFNTSSIPQDASIVLSIYNKQLS